MMFSSNQVLSVSGELDIKYIKHCLSFALQLAGYDYNSPTSICTWQITEDGRYCIGWASGSIPNGWNTYDFAFDVDTISEIIYNHMSTVDPYKANNCAACSGFIMDVVLLHTWYTFFLSSKHSSIFILVHNYENA